MKPSHQELHQPSGNTFTPDKDQILAELRVMEKQLITKPNNIFKHTADLIEKLTADAFPSPSSAMTGEVREAIKSINEDWFNGLVDPDAAKIIANALESSLYQQMKQRNEELRAWRHKIKGQFMRDFCHSTACSNLITNKPCDCGYRAMVDALLELPEVSHANLKAQYQAEALREAEITEALKSVLAERKRQTQKWGVQTHDDGTWLQILSEEVGEYSEACLHNKYGGPKAQFETRMPDISNFTKEELKELDWIITEGFSLFLRTRYQTPQTTTAVTERKVVMPPKAKSKKKREKQEKLPGDVGADPKSIPAIEKKVDELHDTRIDRIDLSKKEGELQAEIVALMHAHNLTVYKFDDKTVRLEGKEKIKIKTDKPSVTEEV